MTMNLSSKIKSSIEDFIDNSPDNSLKNKNNEKAFESLLIGFSSGNDDLYRFFKKDIGVFYWEPVEIFTKKFPNLKVSPDELTVISWVLPQTEVTKSDNRKTSRYPAERWVRARTYGEEFNDRIRKYVMSILQKSGYSAVAPVLAPDWKWNTSKRYGFASSWSERHAAFVSGLGTFGLCDGLITPLGKAMRCGSVISNIKMIPTKRKYKERDEYCLFFSKGLCGKCIERCPVSAITIKGHDKIKCEKYLNVIKKYVNENFGFEGYACGLCQTRVPCESKIPTETDLRY